MINYFYKKYLLFRYFRYKFRFSKYTSIFPPLEDYKNVSINIDDIKFRPCTEPTVSIILPVFNKIDYTLKCLYSIMQSVQEVTYEIIVVDDASTNDCREILSDICGIRYIYNKKNAGFLRSCNKGASIARGDYILFLNNDTIVQSHWLDELHNTFIDLPNVGLVGSQLRYPNGLLQEAGGIIKSDASGINYGRGDDPNEPKYNYMREVDYCSGASLMIPKELFSRIGGFDCRFIPAYYEDTDLAFSVREKGYKVLYQPLSKIIHYEGVSCGNDMNSGVKSYQKINHIKFYNKWQQVLENYGEYKNDIYKQIERRVKERVVIIDACTPTPDKDSGSVDAFNLMKILCLLSYKVTFIPANLKYMQEYTSNLQRIGVECLYLPYVRDIKKYIKNNADNIDIIILSRVNIACIYMEYIRKYCKNTYILFNTVDLHYLREKRQAEFENSFIKRLKSEETRKRELGLINEADGTIIISQAEMTIIEKQISEAKLYYLPLIMEIENNDNIPFNERRDIFFIGNYQHPPNVDAIKYFVKDIWPKIRTQKPDMKFYVLGSNLPQEIAAINEKGVIIQGYEENISAYFNSCRLMVSPLLYGAGMKGKIGRSLGYGLPCVATPISIEGMGLTPNKNILVSDGTTEFADAVLYLYSNEEIWNIISKNSKKYFNENFSLQAGVVNIKYILSDILN